MICAIAMIEHHQTFVTIWSYVREQVVVGDVDQHHAVTLHAGFN
jgi:hypothetical protein